MKQTTRTGLLIIVLASLVLSLAVCTSAIADNTVPGNGYSVDLQSSTGEFFKKFKPMVDDPDFWTVENAASFSQTYRQKLMDIEAAEGMVPRYLLELCDIPYGLPSSDDISETAASSIALEAILGRNGWTEENLLKYASTITYRVYEGVAPYWRVCYKIAKIEDYHLYHEGILHAGIVINIDAKSGKILMIVELDEMVDPFDHIEFPDDPQHDASFLPEGRG